VAKHAIEVAQASAVIDKERVKLAYEPPHKDFWHTPFVKDPFAVPLEDKVGLFVDVHRMLSKAKDVKITEGHMAFYKDHILFCSTEGSDIEQILLRGGAGYKAVGVKNGEVQVRSFPNSFRGQFMSGGYEVVESLGLVENAEQVRDEVCALLAAPLCPEGIMDVIIGGSQLALQIHESVGHPTELDRVLGYEANFAGTSFVTIDKLGKFRYGSPIVNLVADATVPGGLATRGYDDDGVRSQRWFIVQDGIFVGYHTNREVARFVGEGRSRGANRADSFRSIPIIRISNLSLLPGEWELDELIKDTKKGLLIDTNKSWSIDQKRLNFQFGTEIAWEIKNGKLGRIFKNPVYHGITPEFWNSCDAICNEKHWVLWGVHRCGKGEPVQISYMSHGAAPARFRKLHVGAGG